MSLNSKLAAALGFPLGGAPNIVALALSIATCSSTCLPYLTLNVSAVGLVRTSGTIPVAQPFRNSQLAFQLGACLGDNINLRIAAPNSVLGIARAQSSIAAKLGVTAFGKAKCSGQASVHISPTAFGTATTLGTITTSAARQIGATSVATTSGQIPAVNLKVTALGIATTSGAIPTVTISARPTAVGKATASGSAYLVTIGATALGQVQTLGSCTIPLAASQITCVSGSGGPITPSPPNAVF